MDAVKPIAREAIEEFNKVEPTEVGKLLAAELANLGRKIVVLDDDPTGVQTVHSVAVFTDWEEKSFLEGFAEDTAMFFILTNSRAFSVEQTTRVHRDIARRTLAAAGAAATDFLMISRGDSTLRGHYPLETEVLRATLEELSGKRFDGEVILPFFREGGRFTIGNVHYVQEGEQLVPAGQTEFARDRTFGYKASHLGQWCEEKTDGRFRADGMVYIPLEMLRSLDFAAIERQLLTVNGFNKVIVNAVDYVDVEVFCIALLRAIAKGKEFLFRSSAALPKVLGGVPDKPLLGRDELVAAGNSNGGIILVGSHVAKTTQQLEELRKSACAVSYIEFNQHLILSESGLAPEVRRVVGLAEKEIASGTTVAIYTRRDRFDLPTSDREAQLRISVEISDAVTSIIDKLAVQPSFIVAKGGITSSDVGIKGLGVRKALVMGQILPGVPVWKTGPESKFPGMPYIIFPGNVGTPASLRDAVAVLMG